MYIEVQDSDGSTINSNTIDVFFIDIPSSFPTGEMSALERYIGLFGWAEIELSYTVECLEGYIGDFCEIEDHCFQVDCGIGECENLQDGFVCLCPDSFLGEFCETRDNCFDVDCGNGECENKEDSFTCICEPSYMGRFCQLKISEKFDPGPAIGGAIAGVILLLLLLTAGILVAVLLLKRTVKKPSPPEQRDVELDGRYMDIKKEPLAIQGGVAAAISSPEKETDKEVSSRLYSRPAKKLPPVPQRAATSSHSRPIKKPPQRNDTVSGSYSHPVKTTPQRDEGAPGSLYSRPAKKIPQRDEVADMESGYATPDTTGIRTKMTVNVAYGQMLTQEETAEGKEGGYFTLDSSLDS